MLKHQNIEKRKQNHVNCKCQRLPLDSNTSVLPQTQSEVDQVVDTSKFIFAMAAKSTPPHFGLFAYLASWRVQCVCVCVCACVHVCFKLEDNYNIVMVFPIHQNESATGVHVSNPSWTPLPSPSPPYPSGLSQALALGALLHALNWHWSSSLQMVMYMFQCYSLKSSLPHLLPLSPKVCSCLLCCPACRIIGTIFLNSIYRR